MPCSAKDQRHGIPRDYFAICTSDLFLKEMRPVAECFQQECGQQVWSNGTCSDSFADADTQTEDVRQYAIFGRWSRAVEVTLRGDVRV